MTISKDKLLIALLAVACQTTDVMIGPLKFWEVLAISVFPLFIRLIDRKTLYFMIFFLATLALSFVAVITNDVAYASFSILKSKFVISIVRTIELTLCLVVTNSLFNLNNYRSCNYTKILRIFLDYNLIFISFSLLLYLTDLVTGTNLVSYGPSHRLRSFYAEGGPYGLYISTLLFIESVNFKRYLYILIFIIVLLLTKSKSGYIFSIIGFCYLLLSNTKQLKDFVNPQRKAKFIYTIIMFISLTIGATYFIGNNYINAMNNISREIAERPTDRSLVMGRVAGAYIGYNIITNNPILGVGTGNYSLVRNNLTYRGIFPAVDNWDLIGFGGIFNILVENGIIGILIFSFTIILFFRFNKESVKYLILFILPFLLGAQLYWIYPWVYIGFYRLSEKLTIPVNSVRQSPQIHANAHVL
jgi:hypothetical protein